jgi:hypothetical protein
MSEPKQREYVRRFLLFQRKHFTNAAAGFIVDKRNPGGVQRWNEANKSYYKHAIAACNFMIKQLEFYKEPPFYPSKTKPTR